MKLTDQEYEARFAAYLKEQGTPATGVMDSSAWLAMKHAEFREILRSAGYEIEESAEREPTKTDSSQTKSVPFDGRTMTKTYRFKGGQTFSFGKED